jgi:tetratricopeptide (TPR) repeat protein
MAGRSSYDLESWSTLAVRQVKGVSKPGHAIWEVRMTRSALVLFLVVCTVAGASSRGEGDSPVEPKVHQGDGWAIAAPADWQPYPAPPRPVALYAIGDGREGVPLFDGALGALKAGIQLQVFDNPAKQALKDRLAKDLKELKASGAFQLLAEPAMTEVKLADGSAATLLECEFVRKQNGRVSFQSKLYCEDAKGRHLVTSGFVTCSRPGRLSVKAMGLPAWVRAHVQSLVLDPQKCDVASVRATYEKYDRGIAEAIARTSRANALIEHNRFTEAAAAFRQVLKRFPEISAAQNGLAWALLSDRQPNAESLKEALAAAAAAVKETEELDVSALDTLAWAQQLNGDKPAAIKTIEKALKLQPGKPELVERRKSLEEPGDSQ